LPAGLAEGGVFGTWMVGWALPAEAGGIGGCDLPEDSDLAGALAAIGGVDFAVGLAGDLSPERAGELSFLAGTGGTFLDTGWAGFDGFTAFLADGVGFAGFSGLEGLEGFECREAGLDGLAECFFLAAGAGFLCLAMRWIGLFGDL
jgi:hypothetical protein